MKIIYKVVFLFVVSIFLLGCSHHQYFEKAQLMTVDDCNASHLVKKLQNEGVIVSVGKDYEGNSKIELLVPASNIFNEHSANFNSRTYKTLDSIVALLGLYEEEIVQIVCGNKNVENDVAKSSALALARADQIATYLWEQGVDASLVYADGGLVVPEGYIKIGFKNYKR